MSAGYSAPIVSSGSAGFAELDFIKANPGVNAVRDFLTAHGWTNPGSTGTFATGTLTGLGFPSHPPGFGDFNAVPSNAAEIGYFNSKHFVLWDPYWSGGIDPTGTFDVDGVPLVGIPLGSTADGTINNMNGVLTSGTPWVFNLGNQDPATFISHGSVIAKLRGPDWNVDSNSPVGYYSPAASNMTSTPPTTGGWYLFSTPNPVTADQIKMWVYQGLFENLYIQLQFNGTDCPAYPFFYMKYYAAAGPYHFTFQQKPGQSIGAGDNAGTQGGGGYHIAHALHVPFDFAPSTFAVTGVDNILGDVVIHTGTPHGFEQHDRVKITVVLGSIHVNGTWWVYSAPTTTTFKISADNLNPLQADGVAYTSGGTITYGLFESFFSSGDLGDKFSSNSKTCIKTNGVFKTSWTSPHGASEGVMIPLFNIGNSSAPAVTSNAKPLLHPPYIATRIEDDHEAQMAGILWDTYIEVKRENYAVKASVSLVKQMNWLQDSTVSPEVQASMWVQAE